jgi:signal transduction histidine kinase
VAATSAGDSAGRATLPFPAQFVDTVTLGPAYADLRVSLALDPESASSLVIGGLPSSRVPHILALLAATIALLGVAWRQWSDERRLAHTRARFIAGASHELRTPIAQIRLFADTLALGRVRSRDEHDRSLAIIQTEAGRLAHLVDNLLHATRGGRMPGARPKTPTWRRS